MKRIAVVGGGIVGLCAAALLERGFEVTVYEPKAGEDGCSWGNGGLVVARLDCETLAWSARFALAGTKAHAARCAPVLRDLNLASREIYARLAGEMGLPFERRGLLMLSRTHRPRSRSTPRWAA